MKKTVMIASVLMTSSLLLVMPYTLRLLATWGERSLEISRDCQITNYLPDMGLASLTLVCIGLVTTWTTFREMRRSAWFVLLLVALLFYGPILILSYNVVNWRVILEDVAISEFSREVVRHHVGFVLMMLGLLIPIREVFWPSKAAN